MTDFWQFLLSDIVVVLKELVVLPFPLWEGAVVLKGLIFNNYHFRRMWWSCKTDYGLFLLWESMEGEWGILKGLILNNFHFGRV